MPIVRADVPEWLTHEQRAEIRTEMHDCIARKPGSRNTFGSPWVPSRPKLMSGP